MFDNAKLIISLVPETLSRFRGYEKIAGFIGEVNETCYICKKITNK